jgi:hypothetical protein
MVGSLGLELLGLGLKALELLLVSSGGGICPMLIGK